MVEGNDRFDAQLQSGVNHAAVMSQQCRREHPGPGFDTRPLDAEPVGVQAGLGEEGHVLPVTVIAVVRVTAELHTGDAPFAGPPVTVDVVSLDLMGRDDAPQRKSGPNVVIGVLSMGRDQGCCAGWKCQSWVCFRGASGRSLGGGGSSLSGLPKQGDKPIAVNGAAEDA